MLSFRKTRTRSDQQHLVDETRTMAIQQLLMLEWRGLDEEANREARRSLFDMLDEADACGRLLQKEQLLSPEEQAGLQKIRSLLRARRAQAVHIATMPPVRTRADNPPCRLVRSR
jgi:hypothetical protein